MNRLLRPAGEGDARRTFYVLTAVSTYCFTLSFTVNLVYMATVVGLTPFQLVLVGTVLEITCLVFEVPTGIVADLHSRRTSVLIGCALVGLGLLLQAVPLLLAVLAAQIVWGIGSTFTSGATQAWITDEVGEDQIAPVFAREQQIHLGAGLVGTLVAGLLSLAGLAVPMVVSGLGFLALTVWLLRVMPERNFAPTPLGQRETFRHMGTTFRTGLRLAAAGRSSAACCWSPSWPGWPVRRSTGCGWSASWRSSRCHRCSVPTTWACGSPASAWSAVWWRSLRRWWSTDVGRPRSRPVIPGGCWPRWPPCMCSASWPSRSAARSGWSWPGSGCAGRRTRLAAPVEATWLNSELPSEIRATVLSMNGQANAFGQIAGGPPLGLLASGISVRAALVASAAVLAPVVAVYGWLGRRRPAQD